MVKDFMQHVRRISVNNSGLSVVELLVALALLSIFLSMGFTFYLFGVRSFDTGERQSDVQQNARLAGDFITKELRVAERVIIFDEYDGDINEINVQAINDVVDEGIIEDYLIYFIFLKDGDIFYQKITDTNNPDPAEVLGAISDRINFGLDFTVSPDEDNIIAFTLSAEDQETGRVYSFDTEVLVLNTSSIESEYSDSGKAVFFRIPDPPEPAIQTIRLARTGHVYNNPDNLDLSFLDLSVYTANVADDNEININLIKQNLNGTVSAKYTETNNIITDNRVEIRMQYNFSDLKFGYYVIEAESPENNFSSQRRFYYVEPFICDPNIRQLGNSMNHDLSIEIEGIDSNDLKHIDAFFLNTDDSPFNDEDLRISLIDGNGDLINVLEIIQEPSFSNGVFKIRYRLGSLDPGFRVKAEIAETTRDFRFQIQSITVEDKKEGFGKVTIITSGLDDEEKPITGIELFKVGVDDTLNQVSVTDYSVPALSDLIVEGNKIEFNLDLINDELLDSNLRLRVDIDHNIFYSDSFSITNTQSATDD